MGGYFPRSILSAFLFPAALMAVPLVTPAFVLPSVEVSVATPQRKRKRALLPQSLPPRYRRGKRAQAKAARRPNRLHISKRVRRKHRRAA